MNCRRGGDTGISPQHGKSRPGKHEDIAGPGLKRLLSQDLPGLIQEQDLGLLSRLD